MFRTAYYSINGCAFSLSDILHGVLRGNQAKPWFHEPRFRENDPRLEFVVKNPDPRIHFTLSWHLKDSPVVRLITPDNLDAQFKRAAEDYLQERVLVHTQRKEVVLPRVFQEFSVDFGSGNQEDTLRWMLEYLSDVMRLDLESLLSQNWTVLYRHEDEPSPKPFLSDELNRLTASASFDS